MRHICSTERYRAKYRAGGNVAYSDWSQNDVWRLLCHYTYIVISYIKGEYIKQKTISSQRKRMASVHSSNIISLQLE
ncbi:hypothetical protein KFK09_013790 [Dendrobium nobile]|uniref:Uncharacterized protein n=1 Tax=Dendrobium nobile TaxID=94219 RepID=A0A8T3B899_DENNO|nr:hypothetical protein KFK09_013790 [Dendrobium nobile]